MTIDLTSELPDQGQLSDEGELSDQGQRPDQGQLPDQVDAPPTTQLQLRRWVDAPSVVAVLVVRDGEAFLPRTLAAIAAQSRLPDRFVAVDTGSRDGSADLLDAAAAPPAKNPWHLLRTTGSLRVPDAVDAALADPAHLAGEAAWIWVLRDDAAPAPDALEQLLAAVETAPSVAVAGCKQVSWDDGQRLLEVGSTTSRFGARITGMDRGEVDQGQHDRRSDILAVGAAGMLVRRDVWEQLRLHGPAGHRPDGRPGLTGARDDLDLCRRVHLAGHRVVVVPRAVVAHRPRVRFRDDRRDALFLRLATVAWPLLPLALAWSVLAGLGRAVTRLLAKQPAAAADELLALVAVLARPDRWLSARLRDQATRTVPLRALRPLRATGRQLLRQRRDEVAAWIVPSHRNGLVGAHAHPQPTRPGARPGRAVLDAVPVLVLSAAAAVAGGWGLLTGSGAVAGPFLRPLPDRAQALWSAASAYWRGVGLGAPGQPDPLGELLALLSYPLGADPGRLVAVLLVGAPVLAAGTGWLAATAFRGSGAGGGSWVSRTCAALAWAAAPPLLAGALTGRPGAVLAHILLPLLAIALWRTGFEGSVAAAAAAGLLLSAVLAAAPALAVPAAVAIVLAGVLAVLRSGRAIPLPTRLGRLAPVAVAAAVPAVLLLPWWVAVARRPLLLLADPALGWTGPVGLPLWRGLPVVVLLVAGPALLLALVAPLRKGLPGAAAVGCWLVALTGLGVALVGERTALGSSRSWSGPGQSVAFLGLLAAALVAAGPVTVRLRRLMAGVRHVGLAALATLCAIGPVLALAGFGLVGVGALPGHRIAASWPSMTSLTSLASLTSVQSTVRTTLADRSGPTQIVQRVDPDVVPAVAAEPANGPAASRTLALAVSGGTVRWALERGSGPRLGDASAATGTPADGAVVLPVVSALLSGATSDVRPRLADLAVGFVLLMPPVDDAAAQALDAAPGLVRVGSTAGRLLWRVDDPAGRAARVRVLGPDSSAQVTVASQGLDVDAAIDPGPAGRRLVLAERADPGWQASLDGVPLARAVHAGWAQAFALPTAGGRLRVTPPQAPGLAAGTLNGLRVAALLVAAVIAVPLPRVRRRVAPPPAPRRSRPVVRDPRAVRGPQRPPAPRVFDVDHPAEGEVVPVLTPVTARRRLWRRRS